MGQMNEGLKQILRNLADETLIIFFWSTMTAVFYTRLLFGKTKSIFIVTATATYIVKKSFSQILFFLRIWLIWSDEINWWTSESQPAKTREKHSGKCLKPVSFNNSFFLLGFCWHPLWIYDLAKHDFMGSHVPWSCNIIWVMQLSFYIFVSSYYHDNAFCLGRSFLILITMVWTLF